MRPVDLLAGSRPLRQPVWWGLKYGPLLNAPGVVFALDDSVDGCILRDAERAAWQEAAPAPGPALQGPMDQVAGSVWWRLGRLRGAARVLPPLGTLLDGLRREAEGLDSLT
jgi:hypothetical protein